MAEKLEMLKKQYDEKLAQKEELRKKSEDMEVKLERAGLLVSGLASEKARWEETVQVSSGPQALRAEGQSGETGPPGTGTSKNGGQECSLLLFFRFAERSGKQDFCAVRRPLPCLPRPGEPANLMTGRE